MRVRSLRSDAAPCPSFAAKWTTTLEVNATTCMADYDPAAPSTAAFGGPALQDFTGP